MAQNMPSETGTAEELLAMAREIIASLRYCWAATIAAAGGANLRLMGRVPNVAGEDEWTVWFLADSRSRKAAEVRRSSRMTVAYASEAQTAYVTLIGGAVLVEDRSTILARWQEGWDSLFPEGKHDLNAVFIKVDPDRIEVFREGMRVYAALERDPICGWQRAQS